MKKFISLLSFICVSYNVRAQESNIDPDIFNRITRSVKDYKVDTSAAPNDKLTKKIIEFRNLKGGFNVNESILFKFGEEEANAKDDSTKSVLLK